MRQPPRSPGGAQPSGWERGRSWTAQATGSADRHWPCGPFGIMMVPLPQPSRHEACSTGERASDEQYSLSRIPSRDEGPSRRRPPRPSAIAKATADGLGVPVAQVRKPRTNRGETQRQEPDTAPDRDRADAGRRTKSGRPESWPVNRNGKMIAAIHASQRESTRRRRLEEAHAGNAH